MRIVIISFIFCIAVPSYGAECKKNISENEAIVIAEKHLLDQEWNTRFQKKAEHVSTSNCEWIVWFKNVKWKEIKPSRGKASVSMGTGKVEWLPSR